MSARIGIIGAGAIGGWLGIKLAQAGNTVSVLARGETLRAIQERCWRLQTDAGETAMAVAASDDPSSFGTQDVIVIAVKGPALPSLARTLRPMVAPDTVIIPAMNGVPWWFLLAGGGALGPTLLKSVDPTEEIAEILPYRQVIGCVIHASASVAAPGIVRHKTGNRLILGEPRGSKRGRLSAIAGVFAAASFEVQQSSAIEDDIWYKLWGNMTMNPISALTGATCDRILADGAISAFVLRAMEEAREIGARIGSPITESGEDRNAVTRKLGAFKTSMLQDAEAGRQIELDQLLGAPLEIAGRLALPVPNMEALFGLTRLYGQSRGLYRLD